MMRAVSGHSQVLVAISSVVVVVSLATWFAVRAIQQSVPLSWAEFLAGMAVLTGTNIWLLVALHQIWSSLTLPKKIIAFLWLGVAFWYWSIAPVYFLVTMNLNDEQLTWTALAYFWEVPVIGGGLFVTISWWLFIPIRNYVKGHPPESPLDLYRFTFYYPFWVGLTLFSVSIVGYAIGGLQLGYFADWPVAEQIKNIVNGGVIALFLALFFYVVLDRFLNTIRANLTKDFPDQQWPTRSFRRRIAAVATLVSIGSVGLLALVSFQIFQLVIERRVALELLAAMEQVDILLPKQSADNHAYVLDIMRRGNRGQVFAVASTDEVPISLAPPVREALRTVPRGVARDVVDELKLVAFFTPSSTSERIVSVVYLTDFYTLVDSSVLSLFIFGGTLVLVLTVAIIFIATYLATRDLQALTAAVASSSPDRPVSLPPINTGDEVDSLTRTFGHHLAALQQAKQRAESLDHAKTEFISLASHQLRTPLTAIRWYTERLRRHLVADTREAQDAKIIDTAVGRMGALVNDLLNVSRLNSGRLAVRPEPINLSTFLEKIVHEAAPLAAGAGCHLTLSISAQSLAKKILIDTALLRHVLTNLLTNAFRYTKGRSTPEVDVVLTADKDHYLIGVTDNGIGIPAEALPHIFTKFYRAANAAAVAPDGTGLGLYIAQSALEVAGGRITCVSVEGQGTTFTVIIPQRGMRSRAGEIGLS